VWCTKGEETQGATDRWRGYRLRGTRDIKSFYDGGQACINEPMRRGTDQAVPASSSYTLLDTSRGTPATLISLANVRGKTINPDTNTLFMITDQGLTAIRDLSRERAYADELTRYTGAW
jgi:hypothetical protein